MAHRIEKRDKQQGRHMGLHPGFHGGDTGVDILGKDKCSSIEHKASVRGLYCASFLSSSTPLPHEYWPLRAAQHAVCGAHGGRHRPTFSHPVSPFRSGVCGE